MVAPEGGSSMSDSFRVVRGITIFVPRLVIDFGFYK